MFEMRVKEGTDAIIYNDVEREVLLNVSQKFRVLEKHVFQSPYQRGTTTDGYYFVLETID